ncbi:MAG: hypothetical protein AB1630_08695 [bacterium]
MKYDWPDETILTIDIPFPGMLEQDFINTCPGSLRFKDIEIIPSINVSSDELANIPDFNISDNKSDSGSLSPSLDPSLVSPPWYNPYETSESNIQTQSQDFNPQSYEGKFIKYQDYTFYIMNGKKRLIPNNSVKAYAPDGTSITELTSEQLSQFPTGDVLPEIKYPDGSLIKTVEYYSNVPSLIKKEDYFLIFSGTKHLIDTGTMQIFSLKPNDAKSISDDEFLSILNR